MCSANVLSIVTPVNTQRAQVPESSDLATFWIPACAGMTGIYS